MKHGCPKCFLKCSYKAKLLILLLPVIGLTMLLIMFFSVRQVHHLVLEKWRNLYSDLCLNISDEIERRMAQAMGVTEAALYNDAVNGYIFGTAKGENAMQRTDRYNELLRYNTITCEQYDYYMLRLFVDDGEFPMNAVKHLYYLSNFTGEVPLDTVLDSRYDQTKITGVYKYEYTRYNVYEIVSCARFVVDGSLKNIIGAVVVDIRADDLLAQWSDDFEFGRTSLRLEDQNGQRIASCAGGEDVPDEAMHISLPVGDYGWTLVASISADALYAGSDDLVVRMLVLLALVGGLLCIAVALITDYMTRPLVRLRQVIGDGSTQSDIRKLTQEKLSLDTAYGDEVDQLIHAYNGLLNRIDQLTQEFEKSIARETESRMVALQSQINPHFLYNTLATIRSYIEINDPARASDLLMRLAGFFRCALSNGYFIITLEEEMQINRMYLDIQKAANSAELEYTISILDDKVREVLVPKFILQPFVENAVLYGQARTGDVQKISIFCRLDRDEVCITIEDNGPGLPEEWSRALTGTQKVPPRHRVGYGIRNVRKRLKLFYGGQATLCFSNIPEGGTRVEIRIRGLERSQEP